jgi:iron complex outermembrane recepter protein
MKLSNTQTRARFARSISFAALALAMSAPAFAQDAEPASVAEDEDTLVVTGFRASLESAVNKKKKSDQVVESVSAEDIGKLPDASIGESIARLPGLTSQRLNGRANVIAIRGLGPDFSQTLLNGREQTSTGDNRAVEFDQYPSEIVSRVDVYKTPSASLVGQGLVGTVDIRTIRPLEAGKKVFAIGARGTYADLGALNAGSKSIGYRANATFVDQFADDTLGIAVSASYVNEPYQLQEFNAWGYAGAGTTASPNVIGGSKSFVTSTELKRFGVNGTLQYKASDQVMMTFDAFYSKFDDDQSKRGIELPLGFGAFGTAFNPATATVVDGFATAGTFTNVRGVVRNDIFQRKADLFSFGYNAKYDSGTGWKGFVDAGYSRTDRNELSIESYSGTGFNADDINANGASATIRFTSGLTGTVFSPSLNYSDPNLIRLTDPLGWGGGTVPQAGYYNNRIVDDQLAQYRGEIEREISNSIFKAVKFGGSYTVRDKSLTPDESLVRLRGGALSLPIPAENLLESTNLSYLGLGPIVSYDARDLISNGTLVLESNNGNRDVRSKAYRIKERLATGYVQLDIDQELEAGSLTGNVGVQAINTDQSSNGVSFLNGVGSFVNAGASYWDVLPSLNLAARLDTGFVVRFAAAREIQRPRLDDLRVAISYGLNTSVTPTILSGGGGNPTLRPYRATAYDLNFEQYFAGSGVVALQLFYKKFDSYIAGGRTLFDYTGFPLPTGARPGSLIGTLDTNVNTGGGEIYGGEAALTLPFKAITSALDGFGFTGGLGYTISSVRDGNGNKTTIPGYSKWVANGTLFFEKGGFNARGSARYRSTFLGDFTGFGGSPTRRTALAETIVDAQLGYDFQEGSSLSGLSLYLQGQNLTDERFASVANADRPIQVLDYQIYGRRFLGGFTYKF